MTDKERDRVNRAEEIQRYTENRCESLEKENEGLKKNLERYSQKIAEQEKTINAQDDKINFYVAKMNENILKRQEFEKENAELKMKLLILENKEQVVTTTVSD